jgi:hypothetical protein
MKIARALCLLPTMLAGVALANPLPPEVWFTKRVRNSEVREKIASAAFEDELCFHIKGFASDGEHVSEISIFDAGGREIGRFVKTVFTKLTKWRAGACLTPVENEDIPGEWWFTVTLDGALVASASIMVVHGAPKAAEPAAKPQTRKEPQGYPRARGH